MNPYQMHIAIINRYVLKKPGDTRLLKRDTSKDRRDIDIIKQNHKFLWDNETPNSWEERLAKKYYDRLFKEYCICDLKLYKENKVALRWRTEKEVISGKGQFECGSKECNTSEDLRTWEVNFAYKECDEKKNALVKLRLCPPCSNKLNYRTRKRELKRLKTNSVSKKKHTEKKPPKNADESGSPELSEQNSKLSESITESSAEGTSSESLWARPLVVEKTREEEFEAYLEDLLF